MKIRYTFRNPCAPHVAQVAGEDGKFRPALATETYEALDVFGKYFGSRQYVVVEIDPEADIVRVIKPGEE